MKKCPYCAEEVQEEAIFCKHCRQPISTPSPERLPKDNQPIIKSESALPKIPKATVSPVLMFLGFLLVTGFVAIYYSNKATGPSVTNLDPPARVFRGTEASHENSLPLGDAIENVTANLRSNGYNKIKDERIGKCVRFIFELVGNSKTNVCSVNSIVEELSYLLLTFNRNMDHITMAFRCLNKGVDLRKSRIEDILLTASYETPNTGAGIARERYDVLFEFLESPKNLYQVLLLDSRIECYKNLGQYKMGFSSMNDNRERIIEIMENHFAISNCSVQFLFQNWFVQ